MSPWLAMLAVDRSVIISQSSFYFKVFCLAVRHNFYVQIVFERPPRGRRLIFDNGRGRLWAKPGSWSIIAISE